MLEAIWHLMSQPKISQELDLGAQTTQSLKHKNWVDWQVDTNLKISIMTYIAQVGRSCMRWAPWWPPSVIWLLEWLPGLGLSGLSRVDWNHLWGIKYGKLVDTPSCYKPCLCCSLYLSASKSHIFSKNFKI